MIMKSIILTTNDVFCPLKYHSGGQRKFLDDYQYEHGMVMRIECAVDCELHDQSNNPFRCSHNFQRDGFTVCVIAK